MMGLSGKNDLVNFLIKRQKNKSNFAGLNVGQKLLKTTVFQTLNFVEKVDKNIYFLIQHGWNLKTILRGSSNVDFQGSLLKPLRSPVPLSCFFQLLNLENRKGN